MGREWQPGDVAMVTDPVHGELVALFISDGSDRCWHASVDGELRCLDVAQALDARSVVVIDPEDREQVERLLAPFFGGRGWSETTLGMQAALREYADPKPPKPAEPTGLGAVVEVHGRRWVSTGDCDHGGQWWYSGADVARWDEFDSVTTLSEGVTP